MFRFFVLLYGLAAYAVFVISAVLLAMHLATTSDASLDWNTANITIDVGLLALFYFPHSIMARQWFKRWWSRIVPDVLERSTYVLVSAVLLIVLTIAWRDLPGSLWSAEEPWAVVSIRIAAALCFVLIVASSWSTRESDLFGVRRVWLFHRSRPHDPPLFLNQRSLYRFVRHPMMTGLIGLLWLTPTMSWNRFAFVLAGTVYIVIATEFEERDLIRQFGEQYTRYRNRVPRFVPRSIAGTPVDEIEG